MPTAGIVMDSDFAFAGLDTPATATTNGNGAAGSAPAGSGAAAALSGPGSPLGLLAGLEGTWKGTGFNAIWRPHDVNIHDRFLELNLTDETLTVTKINGPIPNRGLAMPDITMHGLTYLQQIKDATTGAGLHIEPGIWATVPQTTDPSVPPTVVRMASIPHGTVILAQGVSEFHPGGPQHIPNNNIFPFFFGSPVPANSDFAATAANFGEIDLSAATTFRSRPPGVNQALVNNPNSILQSALQNSLQGTTMKNRVFLNVSTQHTIVPSGGGTANTAFLAASTNPSGGNARSAHVEATFWIETIAGQGGAPDVMQLQYTQLVMLDFNGIHWPHVTVGTLLKQ